MTILSQTRCDEIIKVAETLDAMMAGGRLSRSEFTATLDDWTVAVDEVNAALGEVEKLLAEGLRDEALSMHHPDLVKVARRLALRQRGDWTRVHGWMLEHGIAVPPEIDAAAAEQMEAAAAEVEHLHSLLDQYRHLVLAHGDLEERLQLLWQLRDLDAASPVWLPQVDEHERALLDDLRRRATAARRAGDIDHLAVIEELLGDFRWAAPIPANLRAEVAGARTAARLRDLRIKSAATAAELGRLVPALTSAVDPGLAAALAAKNQLDQLISESEELEADLAAAAEMLDLARRSTDGLGCADPRAGIGPALQTLAVLEAEHATRGRFTEACGTLEYLTDHPPSKSGELAWLADLQRAEMEARHACQQVPSLTISPLLAEKVRRGVASLDSRLAMRRRFMLLIAACVVLVFLGMTAIVGWFIWQRGERNRLDERLEAALVQAQAGGMQERPAWLAGLADGADRRSAAVMDRIDAAIGAEHARAAQFEERLSAATDAIEDLAADIDRRRSAGERAWLVAWPEAYARAVPLLAEARRSGGLPERRAAFDTPGGRAEASLPTTPRLPAEARARFEAEETRFARLEGQLADHDQELERLADRGLQDEISDIEQRIAAGEDASWRELRDRCRRLRDLAAAAKSSAGSLPGRRANRCSDASLAALDVIERRLDVVARNSAVRAKPEPPDSESTE